MATVEEVKDKKDDIKHRVDSHNMPSLVDTQPSADDKENPPLIPSLSGSESVKARELTTKEAYFASLNEWVKNANISQNAMALFPWYLMSSYPQIFNSPPSMPFGTAPSTNTTMPNLNIGNFNAADANLLGAGPPGRVLFQYRVLSEQMQTEVIQRTGGYEYAIAPFWKRVVAELIDMVILLVLKIAITYTIMNLFDVDLGFDLDKEVLRKAVEDDDYTSFLAVSMDFLAFSSDLIMLEILTKIIVCFYEAIWTAAYNGATPGKAAMHLRIQYVEAVYPLQQQGGAAADAMPQAPPLMRQIPGIQIQRLPINALLYPAEVPSFQRAFMRALAKNMIMTLFFPMCFIMIFFKNNRTAYDVVTKTIVVEENPNPVLRRLPL